MEIKIFGLLKANLLLTFTLLFTFTISLKEYPVKIMFKDSILTDLAENKYPVNFSEHNNTQFSPLKEKEWSYGILTEDNKYGKWKYSLEIPKIGRMLYVNPDTKSPVVIDQIEWHHPYFTWHFDSYNNIASSLKNKKSLLDILSEKSFLYQNLVGDVHTNFNIKEATGVHDVDYIKALRYDAPRQKVIRKVLKFKTFL